MLDFFEVDVELDSRLEVFSEAAVWKLDAEVVARVTVSIESSGLLPTAPEISPSPELSPPSVETSLLLLGMPQASAMTAVQPAVEASSTCCMTAPQRFVPIMEPG